MNEQISGIANKFLTKEDCSREELTLFKSWLSSPSSRDEVEMWLTKNWAGAAEMDSHLLIEDITRHIENYQKRRHEKSGFSFKSVVKIYQRVAAFILIPVIILGVLYWIGQSSRDLVQYTETIAPRGQKSQIILTDGTKVWLNSETKIRYPGRFGNLRREVYLEGEAFFEVARNSGRPFIVHASELDVKVLGTKFNIKAYPDENQIETSLFEGKINLLWNDPLSAKQLEREIDPKQSFVYDKFSRQVFAGRFLREEINGWKKNQLIFKDDTFSNLVRKVERWYDIDIIYDEKQFSDRQLTVELYEGERLERLLEVISLTLSVDYQFENGKIILTPKS